MKSNLKIEPAKIIDIPILLKLIFESFKDVAVKHALTIENCPRHTSFYTKERLYDDFTKGMKYYILYVNDELCGCVALKPAESGICYLGRLAVLPKYRNKGYGKILVNHIFEEAIKTGFKRVEISMISKDKKLKNWYKDFGFIQKETKKYNGFPFIIAFLYKNLIEG